MSINETTLPDFVIAALYHNNLLEEISGKAITDTTKKQKPKKEIASDTASINHAIKLQYLGKNLKQFVILVNYKNEVYLPDEQLSFLSSILTACHLNLADVAIINIHNQKISLATIQQLEPKNIVLFGVDYSLLNIHHAALYQLQEINGLSIFAAEKLELHNQTIPEAIQLKKHLWTTLKQMLQLA